MADAYIVGVGMVPFGKHLGSRIEQLAQEACGEAMSDAGLGTEAIDEVFCGSSYGGPLLGQRIGRDLGLTGIPITNIENACSSSATALRQAVIAIRAGQIKTALIVGADMLTKFPRGTIPLETTDLDARHGGVMPAVYAMRAQRYLESTNTPVEALAQVAVKARTNGVDNPYGQLRTPTTVDEVLQSRPIAEPLTLHMCCPTGDGAAALLVSGDETLASQRGSRVAVAASVLSSGRYASAEKDISVSELTADTAAIAYSSSGLTPSEIDLFELHDAFTIAELMYYEALGLCDRGEAWSLLQSGATGRRGRHPVNAGGGLLARGHPIGATGAAQICEAVWQIRGEAGERQVARRPRSALTHCTGGGISGLDHGACAIHVLVSA